MPNPIFSLMFLLLLASQTAVSSQLTAQQDEQRKLTSQLVQPSSANKKSKSKVDDIVTVTTESRDGPVDWLVDKRNSWAKGWVKMASSIDGFLAGSEAENQAEGSYMRLVVEEAWRETEGFESDVDLKLKLAMPETKKRWNLFVENRLDSQEELESRQSPTITDDSEDNEGKSFYAGLEDSKLVRQWELKRRLGIKLRFPMQPFVSFSLDRQFDLGPVWSARFNNRVFYYHNGDIGSKHELFFERYLAVDTFLRLSNKIRFVDNESRWEYNQAATIQKRLGDKDAMAASFGWDGEQEFGVFDNRYYMNVRYRRALYEDWFFVQVTPELGFEREDDYQPRWGLFTRLEVLFSE